MNSTAPGHPVTHLQEPPAWRAERPLPVQHVISNHCPLHDAPQAVVFISDVPRLDTFYQDRARRRAQGSREARPAGPVLERAEHAVKLCGKGASPLRDASRRGDLFRQPGVSAEHQIEPIRVHNYGCDVDIHDARTHNRSRWTMLLRDTQRIFVG
jgi:hypothetical protein